MSRRPARAPLTLALVLAGAIATLLLADRPAAWSIATTWLIHADWHHLLCDLFAIAAIGFWLEPRVGTARLTVWTFAGWTASIAAGRAFYPQLDHLFGLSTVAWCLAAAGVCACTADKRLWLLALVAALVAWEVCLPNHGLLTPLGKDAASGHRFLASVAMRPVPLAHAAGALVGVVLGISARSARDSQTTQPTEPLRPPALARVVRCSTAVQ